MKRLVPLALFGLVGCAPPPPASTTSRLPPNVVGPEADHQVMTVISKSFFEKSDWNKSWDVGGTLVIADSWQTPLRPEFELALSEAIAESKQSGDEYAELTAIHESLYPGATGSTLKTSNLKAMNLGSRTFFATSDISILRQKYAQGKAFSRGGRTTTARGPVWIPSPPGYSRDGNHAVVMVSAPWSRHHATVSFFLSRTESAWTVAHVRIAVYF